jgi:tetratricopeptide (TPR) repeat protein
MLINPSREPLTLAPPRSGTRPERPADLRQVLAWFEAERRVLLDAVTLAAETGADSHALVGDYQRSRALCEQSLALIAKLGRGDFEYHIWDTLGYAELHLGNFAEAAGHLETALGLCRDYGNRISEAAILTHLGDARHAAGELPRARQAWQQALDIYDDIQHPDAEKVRAKLTGTR